jgi:hypothetical protein
MDNEFIFSLCILVIFVCFWTIFSYVTSTIAKFKTPVDRSACTCDCFDGVFKAEHNHQGYKSIYFNMDECTGFLILFSLSMILYFGFIIKRLLLSFIQRKQNSIIALCMLASIYPIFYSFWAIFNYVNDRLYYLLKNQIVFFITELIISFVNLQSLTNDSIAKPQLIWCSIAFSNMHIVQSMFDQWNTNVGVRLIFYADVISVLLLAYFLFSHCLEKEYYPYTSAVFSLLEFKNILNLGAFSPSVSLARYSLSRLRVHAFYSVLVTVAGLIVFSSLN